MPPTVDDNLRIRVSSNVHRSPGKPTLFTRRAAGAGAHRRIQDPESGPRLDSSANDSQTTDDLALSLLLRHSGGPAAPRKKRRGAPLRSARFFGGAAVASFWIMTTGWPAAVALAAAVLVGVARPYSTTIPASGSECFFETADVGDKFHCSFNVYAGGFLDVDVKVRRAPCRWRAGTALNVAPGLRPGRESRVRRGARSDREFHVYSATRRYAPR